MRRRAPPASSPDEYWIDRMKKLTSVLLLTLTCSACCAAPAMEQGETPVHASSPSIAPAAGLRPAVLLTGSLYRESQDLSGQWTYSKDLYKTGLADINGWVAKSRMQRYRDLDVAALEERGGTEFFEFDM